ncbi:hypothetical protein Glove_259g34 [Diversispora epigaea]|uniref:Protein kinase domain-containing protein n=1 Tax=Diversispora epigaea TaxID=1348612 RepID=A0A397I6W4_9GLOM|nr:hypothetical protein Glove_259g34 [Diversispora epigaea]
MYTKEHFIKKFGTWSSWDFNIDKMIHDPGFNLHWIPYDNFYDIEQIDDKDSIYFKYYASQEAKLKNYMTDEQDYEVCDSEDCGKVTLKELKDYKYNILTFIKVIKNIMNAGFYSSCTTRFLGISKNPSTQNYIIVMEPCDTTVQDYLSNWSLDTLWTLKLDLLHEIIQGLNALHENNFVHCDLKGENISMKGIHELYPLDIFIDPVLYELSDNKNNNVYGSIPYIPPEVLRGNEFTEEGDIYSFGGIMYEVATGNQPFVDQAYDTYLMIDICNGVRPKVPDMMLNLIPKCYLDLLYQCWDDDPSKRPTTREVIDTIISWKISNVIEEFIDADDNREKMSRSHEQKLYRSLSKFHPQYYCTSKYIYTLYELQDSLEDIKSGKCADPNLYIYDDIYRRQNMETEQE